MRGDYVTWNGSLNLSFYLMCVLNQNYLIDPVLHCWCNHSSYDSQRSISEDDDCTLMKQIQPIL